MWQRLTRAVGYRDREWGDWHNAADTETHRYRALADMHAQFAPAAPVLDLGCGAGPLIAQLPFDLPYLGIDCQSEAALIGQTKCGRHQRIVCGDIRTHAMHKNFPFGCVVFSEVLYYQPTTAAALGVLASYAEHIQPPAIGLISIWTEGSRLPKNQAVLNAIEAQYADRLCAQTYVAASMNRGWHLLALRLH